MTISNDKTRTMLTVEKKLKEQLRKWSKRAK